MPIITCCNKSFNIAYNGNITNSQCVEDIVKYSNDVDVIIPVPDKYCSVIDKYVEYVNDQQAPITSRERLFLCFQLNTLFIDDNYFGHLVSQVFNNWSYMCVMVYNEFNDDLQWSFFVLAPYDFVPKYLLDNNLFMKQWNKLNNNTSINVNHGSEIYYNNYETINNGQKVITTYHTISNNPDKTYTGEKNSVKRVGHVKETTYYKNSNNVEIEQHYIDDKEDGPWREWYDNEQHTLKSEDNYVNGKPDSVWREWYDDDQHTLKSERHYVDGKQDSVWREWYDNDQHTLKFEGYYVDDKRDGAWRWWYNNDQHTLKSEGHYVDGKLDGVWRYWYDNDQHALKFEGLFVDDERHGRWLEFDVDGNITSDDVYVNGIKQ